MANIGWRISSQSHDTMDLEKCTINCYNFRKYIYRGWYSSTGMSADLKEKAWKKVCESGLKAPIQNGLKIKCGNLDFMSKAWIQTTAWKLTSLSSRYNLMSKTNDGGHDVINNFEFPCNSMKNLISIWNFTNKVKKNVKWYENFKSVEVGHHSWNH